MTKPGKIEKRNPFRVPDGYFENLNDRILDNVLQNTRKERKTAIKVKMRPLLAAAAAIALLVTTSIAILLNNTSKDHIADNVINTDTITELVNWIDVTVLEEEAARFWNDSKLLDVEKEDIISYLENDNISISMIYELF